MRRGLSIGSESVSEPLTVNPDPDFQSLMARVTCMCPRASLCPRFLCLVCVIVTPPFPCPRPRTALSVPQPPSLPPLHSCSGCSPWLSPLSPAPSSFPSPLRTPAHRWSPFTGPGSLMDSLRNLCVIAPNPPEPLAVQAPSPNPSGRRYGRGVWWH